MHDILLDLRKARGPAHDKVIIYVAVSRATGMDSLKMLSPAKIHQLQTKPDRDSMTYMLWIQERDINHYVSFIRLKNRTPYYL